MAKMPSDVIARENAAVLQRLAGVRMVPASPDFEDAQNPNVLMQSSDAVCSSVGSSERLNPAPRRTAPLRLVWDGQPRD
jgi:hypothetical protein